jgi:anti-anti-sigma regulatory factor
MGRNTAKVRIPRMEFETAYVLLKEQLLSEVYRRPATAWIIDLSEHTDGITLMLAGVLAGLCEEVRRSGSTVKCVGP